MPSASTLLKQASRALDAGQIAAAESFAMQALGKKLDASHGSALFDLGNQLSERDAFKTARVVFERALDIFPGHLGLLNNLGVLYERAGDGASAERTLREAVSGDPGAMMALANLAHLVFAQGRLAEALPLFNRLVDVAPDAPAEVWNNRGVCQQRARDRGAEASFRRALELSPGSAAVLANLGFLLAAQRRYAEARALLERARSLEPDRLQVVAQCVELQLQFCDWTDFEERRAQVIDGVARLPAPGQTVAPFGLLAYCDDPGLQLAAARSFAWPALAPPRSRSPRARSQRLRLGFAASAFHDHPVSRMVAELFERIDRDRFEVIAYDLDGSEADAMRARIESAVDAYVALGRASAGEAAARIEADAIDVLFDLTGHTAGARPEVFAARAAPLQVNYLGYAGTLGAGFYDHAIGDAIATPPALQAQFVEALVSLEGCYLPSDSHRVVGAAPARADYALPEDAFVLVTQAAPYKIIPEMFQTWSAILRAVGNAVLWLRPMPDEAQSNLRAEARLRSVDDARLVFAPLEPTARYLARYRLADLYVDTYPFGSHTTVNDALYAGLPVVTLRGRSMAARASASQACAAGLSALVVDSHEAYVDIVIALARDRARLAGIAGTLADSASNPLFDMDAYVRRFEVAVLDMCTRAGIAGSG
ncbi:MAG: tetratricopeptide repeat protein [Betaproteobacteria bacterium]